MRRPAGRSRSQRLRPINTPASTVNARRLTISIQSTVLGTPLWPDRRRTFGHLSPSCGRFDAQGNRPLRVSNRAPFANRPGIRYRRSGWAKPGDRWQGTTPRMIHPLDQTGERKMPSLPVPERSGSTEGRGRSGYIPSGHSSFARTSAEIRVPYMNAVATDLPAWIAAVSALSARLNVFLLVSRKSCCSRFTLFALRSISSILRSTLRRI